MTPSTRTSTRPVASTINPAARSINPYRTAALFGRFHEVARCVKPKIRNGTIRPNPSTRCRMNISM